MTSGTSSPHGTAATSPARHTSPVTRGENARAPVADGLASLEEADQAYLVADLCLAGLAAEAAIAERATARRDGKAHAQASRIAADLLERARAAARADGVPVSGTIAASQV